MTTVDDAPRAGAPWHLWAVGVLGLLWNSFGAYDYFCSHTKGDAYMRQMGMTEPQIAYFHAMPAWMTAVWAVGVWGAVLGTILLLFRSRWAFHVYVASLVGFLLSLVYAYLLSDGASVMGQQTSIMNLVILAGCLFFVWYSRLMAKRGVLR